MQAHPAFHPDADGGDLVLAAIAFVGAAHPHAYPVLPALARHVERRQRADQPLLQAGHEPAHVAAAPLEVEHRIADALARAVIGELAAAPRRVNRKPRLDEVLRPRTRPGRIERRMLQEPNQFAGLSGRDRGRPCLHGGQCRIICNRRVVDTPIHRRTGRHAARRGGEISAGSGHWLRGSVDDVFMLFTWGSWAASASEANQPLGDRLARVKEIASCAPPNLSTFKNFAQESYVPGVSR